MYKATETPDTVAKWEKGNEFTPVATLADEYGGRAQISIDDHCYIVSLKQEDGTYRKTPWLFTEAVEALRNLPSPREMERILYK